MSSERCVVFEGPVKPGCSHSIFLLNPGISGELFSIRVIATLAPGMARSASSNTTVRVPSCRMRFGFENRWRSVRQAADNVEAPPCISAPVPRCGGRQP